MIIQLYNEDCISAISSGIIPQVDFIITDPPYFVVPKGKPNDKFSWDNFSSIEDFKNFTTKWFSLCYSLLKDDSGMFIFWSQKRMDLAYEIFQPARTVLWQHTNLVIGGNGDFAYDYDPIFYVKKGNPKLVPGKHSCIMNYTKPQSNFKTDKLVHPAQKPIALMQHLVKILPKNSSLIFDPFMGVGTTGVACKKLNRDFIGIEKDTTYFKIAEERIANAN